MGKKNKKTKKKPTVTEEFDREEAKDELLALSAIFGDALTVKDDEQSFVVHVVPHPGEAETNYVSVNLEVRYPRRYPHEHLLLRLTDAQGLEESQVHAVAKALHHAAEAYAADSEVCCFQLVQLCQELLQERNHPPQEDDGSTEAAPESLWEAMQQRQLQELNTSMLLRAGSPKPDADLFGLGEGGLFGEASWQAPLPGAQPHALQQPVAQQRRDGLPPRPPSVPTAVKAERTLASAGASLTLQPASVPPSTAATSRTVWEVTPGSAADVSSAAQSGRSGPSDPSASTSLSNPSLRPSLDQSSSAAALGQSFSTMVRSLSAIGRAVLPRALRRYMEVPSGTGRSGSSLGGEAVGDGDSVQLAAGDEDEEEEREELRKELLVGHLLCMVTGSGVATGPGGAVPGAGLSVSGGPLPPQTLPAVADMLHRQGLVPRWLAWALKHQPAMFNRAFSRLFAREIEDADEAAAADPGAAWVFERFWNRNGLAPRATLRSGSHLPSLAISRGPGAAAAPSGAAQSSRYLSDFSEVKELGRGAYGVVVLAINRFDGRSYAVKRVRLSQQTPSEYARIMREVATLSRLQHPNVVRYFQAWIEAAAPGEGAAGAGGDSSDEDDDEDGELDAWRSASASGPSMNDRRHGRRGRLADSEDSESDEEESEPESLSFSRPGPQRGARTKSPIQDAVDSKTESESGSEIGGGLWQRGNGSSASDSLPRTSSFTFDRSVAHASADVTQSTVPPRLPSKVPSSMTKEGGRKAVARKEQLYIQMEYCPSTLRDVLDAGPLEEEARWKVLRQLLSGLAHIHAQGIIHRDLKPANLFMDARGDIKLGDFGLAKFNALQGGGTDATADPALPAASTPSADEDPFSDATGVCGTSFYIAPEIARGSASYDERVDLYSVGIIAFEVWHPFSTAMERVVLLRDLRERGTLPPGFESAHPQAAALIRWLLSEADAGRPTAREALRSELLPPTVGDEQLTDLLRSLPDNPAAFDRVVEALFAPQRPGEAGALTRSDPPGTPVTATTTAQDPESRERALSTLRAGFLRHGAVAMCSAEIGAPSPDQPNAAVQVLSRSGQQVALRHELRQPFAAWVVGQVASGDGAALIEGFRRYELANVYRRDPRGGPPRAHLQADFDVLTPPAPPGSKEPPITEAEVLCAVTDVLSGLPECAGRWEVRVGHRALFDAALAHVGLPKETRAAAVQLLRPVVTGASPLHPSARQQRWPSVRAGLEGLGVGADAIGRLKQLALQAAGESQAAIHRLASLLPQAAAPAAWLLDLQGVLPLLAAWGIPAAKVAVDPLLPPHDYYFTATTFEVHFVDENSGASTVVAVGGRYDALLRACWAQHAASAGLVGPLAVAPLGGVGATVNVERLIQVASAGSRPMVGGAGLVHVSGSDVLVCCRGSGGKAAAAGRLTERTSGRLMERVRLLRLLWDADIAAEMLPSAAPSLTDQFAYATAHGIPWLVIVNADEVAFTEVVRVKHLNSKVEEDVPVADLARCLLAALQPHATGGAAVPLARPSSSASAMRSTDEADGVGEGEGTPGLSWKDRKRRERR